MANRRDVELAIKARNDAGKAIDSVADALKTLVGAQEQVGKSAQRTDNLLGDLGQAFSTLNSQVQALGALGKVTSQLDRAASAVGRLESEVSSTADDLARLKSESDRLAAGMDGLTRRVDENRAALEQQQKTTASLRAELTQANKELRTAQTAYDRLAKRIAEAKTPSDDLQQKFREQGDTLARLRSRQEQVNASYTAQVAKQGELSAAYEDSAKALTAAQQAQRKFAADAEKAQNALLGQRDALNQAEQQFQDLYREAERVSRALGGVALNQRAVADASQKAAADLAQVGQRLKEQRDLQEQIAAANAEVRARNAQARFNEIVGVRDTPSRSARASADAFAMVDTGDEALVKRVQARYDELRNSLEAAKQQASQLGRFIAASEAPSAALRQQFASARETVAQLNADLSRQGQIVSRLGGRGGGGFQAFEESVKRVRAAAAAGSREAAAAGNALSTSMNGLPPFAARLNDTAGAAGRAAGATQQFGGAVRQVGDGSRQTLSLLQRLRGEVLSLTASYIGLFAAVDQIKQVITAFQTLEAAQSRLGVVFGGDVARVNTEIGFLREQSARLGIAFSTLSNEYGKLAIAANTANFSNAGTREIFLSVAEAGRVSKLSMDQLQGTFLALTQMISKGKVTSEELRRQLGDRLPGAFDFFAKAVGVSTAELDEMLRKGEVIANEDTLVRFARELQKAFGPALGAALLNVTTEIGRFQDNVEKAQQRIAQGGFVDAYGELLRTLNEGFQSEAGQDFFLELGAVLGRLTDVIREVIGASDTLLAILQAFIAIKVAQYFLGLAANVGQAGSAMQVASARVNGMVSSIQTAGGSFAFLRANAQSAATALVGLSTVTSTFSARAAAAAVGARALSASLTGLRAVAVAVTAAATAMWTAVGGLPGIAITAVTFILTGFLGEWLTGVKDATKALDQHEKILEDIRQAYDKAQGSVEKWRDSLKGITVDVATQNLEDLQRSLEEARARFQAELTGVPVGIRSQEAADFSGIAKQFRDGEVSLNKFIDAYNKFFNSLPESQQRALRGIGQSATEFDRLRDSVKRAEAAVRVAGGTADDADRKILGLGESTRKTNDAFDAEKVENYTKALRDLADAVPGAERAARLRKTLEEIEKARQAGLENARTADETRAVQRAYFNAVEAVLKRFEQDTIKALDLPDNRNLVERIIRIEGGQTLGSRQPTTSTSRGIGQFTESTWLSLFDRVFPDRIELPRSAKLEYRFDDNVARQLMGALLQENQAGLLRAGMGTSDTNQYLAYFLGLEDAINLLSASTDTLAANVIRPESVAANRSVLGNGRTVGDVIGFARERVGGGAQLGSDGATEQERFNVELRETLELERLKQGLREREIGLDRLSVEQRYEVLRTNAEELAVLEAQEDARRRGLQLSAAQELQTRVNALAAFDAANADRIQSERRAEVEREVNELVSQRRDLLELIQTYQDAGMTGQADLLLGQLDEVNVKLDEAITKAITFLQTLGGPQAAAAIRGLQIIQTGIRLTGQETQITGRAINQQIAQGGAQAFDRFAQSVAAGNNVFASARDAFLQFAADFLRQIAQMIIQQAILNALGGGATGGGGAGGGIASFISSLFHEGGIVGQRAPGSRAVSPSVFSNALRYHNGGIVGLRPNEVPAILERNEEVLTEDDPRHRFSGGGAASSSPVNVKVVNAIDAGSFLSEGLGTSVGEKAILNFIRANSGAVRSALG